MGPPLVDAVSSRSREAAIETVIDMDPNGAAHRMARTKVGTAICGIDGLWMMMCPCERASQMHRCAFLSITGPSNALLSIRTFIIIIIIIRRTLVYYPPCETGQIVSPTEHYSSPRTHWKSTKLHWIVRKFWICMARRATGVVANYGDVIKMTLPSMMSRQRLRLLIILQQRANSQGPLRRSLHSGRDGKQGFSVIMIKLSALRIMPIQQMLWGKQQRLVVPWGAYLSSHHPQLRRMQCHPRR